MPQIDLANRGNSRSGRAGNVSQSLFSHEPPLLPPPHTNRLSELFGRHRCLIAWGAALLTGIALVGHTRLKFEDVPRHMLWAQNADSTLVKQVYRNFGSDDNDCVLVLEADDLFAPRAAAVIRKIVSEAKQIPGVQSVWSIQDAVVFDSAHLPHSLLLADDAPAEAFEHARIAALRHPMVAGPLLSADAVHLMMHVRAPVRHAFVRGHALGAGRRLGDLAGAAVLLYSVESEGLMVPVPFGLLAHTKPRSILLKSDARWCPRPINS